MKLNQILSINQFYSVVKSQKLPIKTAYKFSKLFDAFSKEADFYTAQLQVLIEEYGLKDENGNLVQSDDENGIKLQEDRLEEFSTKFQELLNLEIEIPDISFSIDELDNFEMSIEDFNNFLPLIKE